MLTPRALAQRRRVLFTMLTTLGFRYPPSREPPAIAGIRQYLDGWPGVGRIVAGMARQSFDLEGILREAGAFARRRGEDHRLPHRHP